MSTLLLHGLIALLAMIGALTVILQSETMALLCPVVVFLLPPLALGRWAWRKARGLVYPNRLRRLLIGLRVAAVTGWGVSLLPGLFWGAVWFHILEPWPFSLSQGPDTEYAREGVRRVFGPGLEADLRRVYYKSYDLHDQDRFLRFISCSRAVKQRVLEALERVRSDASVPAFHLNSRLSWWFTAADAAAFEHWAGEFREVWIDPHSCTFYVRSWSF